MPDVTNCHYLSVYDVTETSGYLASSVTKTSGCGSMLTPWQILAKPGQTINITMLDFSAALNEFYAYHAEPYIPSGVILDNYCIFTLQIMCHRFSTN